MKLVSLLFLCGTAFGADRADLEPFLLQANEKYADGDYQESISICEELLGRDPAYAQAKECVAKGKKALLEQKRRPAAVPRKRELDDTLDPKIQRKVLPR